MAGWPVAAWVWWIAATILTVSAFGLAWWALLSDRPRGRRRCPYCFYDMTGHAGLECPECGRSAKYEKKLFKIRRRWRWAALAAVIVTAATYAGLRPVAARHGWMLFVSSRMLIRLLPYTDAPNGPIPAELTTRMRNDQLSARDWHAFFDRVVEGDSAARPTSAAWQEKYWMTYLHGWTPNWISCAYSAPSECKAYEAHQKLYEIPPIYDLVTRDVWPAGIPLVVHGTYDTWWPLVNAFALQIVPRFEGAQTIVLFGGADGPRSFEISTLTEPGQGVLSFDLTLFQRHLHNHHSEWIEINNDVVDVPYRIEGDLTQIVMPVISAEIDLALRQAETHVFLLPDGVAVDVDILPTQVSKWEKIAFGVHEEYLLNDELIAWRTFSWCGGDPIGPYVERTPIEGDVERLAAMDPNDRLVVRFVSDPVIALRVIDADRYWQGEVMLTPAVVHDGRDGQ